MGTITYRESLDPAGYLHLAQRVWPGNYAFADIVSALSRTINFGAWDDSTLVGSVRVLTDGYFFATIPEILVDPDYRRQGIGRELMQRAVAVAPKGKLYFGARRESAAFFQRIGCESALTGFVATAPLPKAPAG